MTLFRYLYRVPLALLMLLIGLPLTLIAIALVGDKRKPAYHWVVRTWSWMMMWIFGVRIHRTGQLVDDPVVLLANHVSWMDISALHAIHGVGFIAKSEINRWPLVGYMARAGSTIFHERGSEGSREQVGLRVRERLAEGRSIAIFAEGRSGYGGKVLPFHGRMLQPAKDEQVPIQPVAIRYLNEQGLEAAIAFRPRESFVANLWRVLGLPRTRCEVHCLEPIPREDVIEMGRRDIARLARERVVAVMTEYAPETVEAHD